MTTPPSTSPALLQACRQSLRELRCPSYPDGSEDDECLAILTLREGLRVFGQLLAAAQEVCEVYGTSDVTRDSAMGKLAAALRRSERWTV
jgi:hypothetical protein